MTTTTLSDGRVFHIPGTPFIADAISLIMVPADQDLAQIAPLVRADDLAPFTKRLLAGVQKRRFQERYREVNRARLELARLCIDRMLTQDPTAPRSK